MLLIESPSTDPYFNLALEQYVFDSLDRSQEYFMLWQNDNAVIVGKNQNTLAEVSQAYVDEHHVSVVRRLSGGGAVYHDLGNVNFTYIVDRDKQKGFDFSFFCIPVIKALKSLGIEAVATGRNDITIDGKKFSGNAQYSRQNRIMHHGTLLFDSNLEVMRQVLAAPKDRVDSKGVSSTQSLVTNIRPHLDKGISVSEFLGVLRDFFNVELNLHAYALNHKDLDSIDTLRQTVYETWEWNYGYSPPCNMIKERRVEGFGKLQIHLDVCEGTIRSIAFYGDFFGDRSTRELAQSMIGLRMEEDALLSALSGKEIGLYFHNLDLATLISIILR